ncbi:MAG: hypothetical protein J6T33_05020 [Bacteroidales bacterium]|nr:hypothetical protein [Bacteroidales bacterium]MBP5241931.1 hypothetical protein [Bacteroidales bacterium]
MTALQLRADIDNNINIIASDESLMKRLAKYVKRLATEKQSDDTCMSKEEFMAKLDRAEKQIERGESTSFTNREEMIAWLNSL